ncbi:MAG: CCA tRNA nucleotidyltransferase [Terasakiella sp.]|uniref:CCA tRNA nucleotidyltransferase n=1 Tax=unclassified Terasakiella TaxID=2614952 RepID=UPI003B00AC08
MLNITNQDWFCNPVSRRIMQVLGSRGRSARYVGGCVRDALLRKPINDIDIATPELPQTVLGLLKENDIKAIATGIEHGTVTAICEGRSFEITTLRSDVSTDGRRATVAFCEDWLEDAKRRDFTFNAMSLDAEGTLYDPFDGQEDLKAGRVRFIGCAQDRICEDYLRLLRFFRFNAYYGKTAVDSEGLQACQKSADGLKQLSGERITQELLRLLEAPRPARWVDMMIRNDIFQKIIPDILTRPQLEMLCAFEDQPDGLRRLACLLPNDPHVIAGVAKRFRLSKAAEKRLMAARCTASLLDPMKGQDELRCFLYRNGAVAARDQLFLYWAEKGFSGIGPREQQVIALIDQWQVDPVVFPIQGADLLACGFTAGPRMGAVLKEIEDWWCAGGCRAEKEDCLREVQHRQSL